MQTMRQHIATEAGFLKGFKALENASDREIGAGCEMHLGTVWNFRTGLVTWPDPETLESLQRARPEVIRARVREARETLEREFTPEESTRILAALISESHEAALRELREGAVSEPLSALEAAAL